MVNYWAKNNVKVFEEKQRCVGDKMRPKYTKERGNWPTYANMDFMYNKLYSQMVRVGVAVTCNPVWTDKQVNVVTEDKAFG